MAGKQLAAGIITVTGFHSLTMFSEESCSVTGSLLEKMGFQLRSELLATVVWWAEVWWKCVPDNWSRDGETLLANGGVCPWNEQVTTASRSDRRDKSETSQADDLLEVDRQDQYLGHSRRSKQQSWTVSSQWLAASEVFHGVTTCGMTAIWQFQHTRTEKWRQLRTGSVHNACKLARGLWWINRILNYWHITQTCQVSCISHESHAFSLNSRISARLNIISCILSIIQSINHLFESGDMAHTQLCINFVRCDKKCIHYTLCAQLIVRKFSKIGTTSCQILKLKCVKFNFRRAPDPAGELTAFLSPPIWI